MLTNYKKLNTKLYSTVPKTKGKKGYVYVSQVLESSLGMEVLNSCFATGLCGVSDHLSSITEHKNAQNSFPDFVSSRCICIPFLMLSSSLLVHTPHLQITKFFSQLKKKKKNWKNTQKQPLNFRTEKGYSKLAISEENSRIGFFFFLFFQKK